MGYTASFMEGNAQKWLILRWGSDGRLHPNSWPNSTQLSRASTKEDAAEWHRLRLIRTHQSAGAGIEECISKFSGCSLVVPKLDELLSHTVC